MLFFFRWSYTKLETVIFYKLSKSAQRIYACSSTFKIDIALARARAVDRTLSGRQREAFIYV